MVSWNEYSDILKGVYEDIQLKQFDNVIAIGRGGSVIGAYLASKLGIPTFHPIFLRHVDTGGKKRIEETSPSIRDQIRSLSGRLLIVDDYLRDGLAMKYVLELISERAFQKEPQWKHWYYSIGKAQSLNQISLVSIL